MFTRFLDMRVFILSFIIGAVFVQLSAPTKTVVFVYPTPDNIKHIEYRDKAGNCFTYNVNTIPCPKDRKNVRTVPVQMGATKPALPMQKYKVGGVSINKI